MPKKKYQWHSTPEGGKDIVFRVNTETGEILDRVYRSKNDGLWYVQSTGRAYSTMAHAMQPLEAIYFG